MAPDDAGTARAAFLDRMRLLSLRVRAVAWLAGLLVGALAAAIVAALVR